MIVQNLDKQGIKNKNYIVYAMAPNREPDYVYITYFNEFGNKKTIEVDTEGILELAKKIEKRNDKKEVK